MGKPIIRHARQIIFDNEDDIGAPVGEAVVGKAQTALEILAERLQAQVPDAPLSYAGKAGQFPRVNPGETALDLGTISELDIVSAHTLLSFTNTESGDHEVGETVATATFNWAYNRDGDNPTSQIITGTDLDGSPISVAVALRALVGTFTPNLSPAAASIYTYTLNAIGDDTNPSSLTTSIPFKWKMYYGVSALDNILTGPDIMTHLEPQNDDFATSKAKTYAFVPGVNNYVYFAWPAVFGPVVLSIFNGLDMTAWKYSTGVAFTDNITPVALPLTNASGGTTNYYLIRSDNFYNSPATWQIA